MRVRCICIDDVGRPKEIPIEKWVVKNNMYHITHVYRHVQQNMIQGVELEEIFLDDSNFPYQSFALKRFSILYDDIEKFIKMVEECTGLTDIKINIDELCQKKEPLLT
jgi:hypothetical protein